MKTFTLVFEIDLPDTVKSDINFLCEHWIMDDRKCKARIVQGILETLYEEGLIVNRTGARLVLAKSGKWDSQK